MIIDLIVIGGTAFGLLVTLGLFIVYMDNLRSDKHGRSEVDDTTVLGRHLPELPK